jgi:hypothetical protein
MRIRTIKPEFFLHEGLFEAERATKLPLRVAFAGLWCAADREGRFKWEPRRLGVQVLPYDNVEFSRVLDALTTRGFIRYYASGTGEYGVIPSFTTHQVVNNRERESELPEPPASLVNQGIDACGTRDPRDDDGNAELKSGREGKGREQGTGNKEGKGDGRTAPRSPRLPDDEWIQSFENDPTYNGLNIRQELGKMQRWCETNRKQPSRMRFVNWLNRAEKPIGITGQPKPKHAAYDAATATNGLTDEQVLQF